MCLLAGLCVAPHEHLAMPLAAGVAPLAAVSELSVVIARLVIENMHLIHNEVQRQEPLIHGIFMPAELEVASQVTHIVVSKPFELCEHGRAARKQLEEKV